MALTIEFHPQAEVELEEAIEWYEAKKEGLGEKFFREYLSIKEKLLISPKLYPFAFEGVRKAVFRKFPYVILYFVWEELIYVLAVFHTSQDPEIWKQRVAELE